MQTAPQPRDGPPTLSAPAAEVVLGRYRLGRRLGAGGMGVVYLAHDDHLDRAVAVKRIAVGDPAIAKRAEREAKAAARLQHPGIVSLHEAGRDGDTVYLVSELVRGHTLRELLDEGALSDRAVLRIGVALCDALLHAHQRGVVHRDVKPGNILIPARPVDYGGVAKLTDFGVAWMAGDDALTLTGDVVGTLAYMAPEQAEGREITPATDLYSLALVLYEALCGTNPIRDGGPAHPAQTARRIGRRLPALGRYRRDLSLDLCHALDLAVRPEPGDRGSIEDLHDALQDALDEVDDEPGTIAPGWTEATALHRIAERAAPVSEPIRIPARLLAGLAAGALAGAALQWLGPPAPVPVLAVAGGCAAAVALLPRLGWIASLLALVVWLAGSAPGLAAFVALAGVPVVVLVRGTPVRWSLPAVAPGLGITGLATGYVALAGQAPRATQRFALGLLGCWWLVLAEALTGERLLFGATEGVAAAGTAEAGTGVVLRDVAWPLLESGVLLVGVAWGLAAAILPLLVRGRVAAVDMVAATAWAGGLATATQGLSGGIGVSDPASVIPGAILAGGLAVIARAAATGPAAPSRGEDAGRSLA